LSSTTFLGFAFVTISMDELDVDSCTAGLVSSSCKGFVSSTTGDAIAGLGSSSSGDAIAGLDSSSSGDAIAGLD
jgi:hypothetical protein